MSTKYSRLINRIALFHILFLVAVLTSISTVVAEWRLPETHYVAAKMPMTLVHPRPDNETATWARHRLAYPDGVAEYRIPVTVQGGAYPFRYELVQGPPGMQIGGHWSNEDYGIITWRPTSNGGPYNVSVRITDQEGATVTANWTVRASTEEFIFIDPRASTSGDGRKNSPLRTFADMHRGSRTDSTFSGKIIYFRGGTHLLDGPESNGNLQLQQNYKPAVWLGYTGENVVIDSRQSKVLVDAQHDIFVSNLRMTNARADVANAHFWFFNANSAQNRVTFFEVDFDNIGRGTAGSDNPAAVTFFNPGNLRRYFTFNGNTYQDYSAPLIDLYAMRYGVVENNILRKGKSNAGGYQGIFLKSDIQDFSVRGNVSLEQDFQYGAIEIMLQAQVFTNDRIEVAYNFINEASNFSDKRAIVYNWNSGRGANTMPQIYIYRNTVIGKVVGLDSFPYIVSIERNIVLNNETPVINGSGTNRQVIESDNITGRKNSGIVDPQSGILSGDFQQYAGRYGHILSSKIISPPSNVRFTAQ